MNNNNYTRADKAEYYYNIVFQWLFSIWGFVCLGGSIKNTGLIFFAFGCWAVAWALWAENRK